jgi:hypothetical protein
MASLAEHHPWYIRALVHWLSGVAFAILLGFLITVVGPDLPGISRFLHDIEQRGIDYAMRTRLLLRGPNPTDGYVFLDLDTPFCERFVNGNECRWRSPAKPEAIAKAVTALLPAGPKAIIVDAELWDVGSKTPPSQVTFSELAAAIKAHPETRVLAASPYRPTGSVGHGTTDMEGLPPYLTPNLIEFAPAWVWTSASDTDAIVRQYPAYDFDADQPTPQPSLAFSTALAINPRIDRAVCSRAATGRLLYSLPSLVPPADGAASESASPMQEAFLFHYDRFLASKAIALDGGVIRQNFASKVVVVGSSAPIALDVHDTPLGQMAGPEIHLNAVKAFLDCPHGFITSPPIGKRAWYESEIIAVTSIPFLLFWLGYFWLASAAFGGRAVALLPAAGALGFCLAIAGAIALAVIATLGQINNGAEEGFSLEFFTPIIALSLEGFAEGARWISERIERRVESLILLSIRLLRGTREG